MCGISGAISKKSIDLNTFIEMNHIIRHRGPDDEGYVLFNDHELKVLGSVDTAIDSWSEAESYLPKERIENISFESKVAFGHRRLSILDLSAKGHQPMCSSDCRYWITFNGEIYNYIEVREELIKNGYIFNTDSDTEVVLYAYQHWGTDCQERFKGMWAFAIYDKEQKTIFLSRDRFGIKPMYYWFSPSGDFYFASEIKQFTTLPGWKAVLNKKIALDFLYTAMMDHTDETLFKGVYKLLPGHYFLGKTNEIIGNISSKLNSFRWYNIKIFTENLSFTDAVLLFRKKFETAISQHLRADVNVGSALSGGLDSSSIVSYVNILLKQQGKVELQKTFSSCATDERFDERKWMNEVEKATGVDSHYIYPKGENIFNLTEKIVWHLDEPYQSQAAFLSYHVFEASKKNKTIVLLNGQGADEYLSGYGQFRVIRLKNDLKSLKIKKVINELNNFGDFFSLVFSTFLDKVPHKIVHFFKYLRFKYNPLNKLINLTKIKKDYSPFDCNYYNRFTTSEALSNYQIYIEPLQKYLKWEDRNSMAHSVEARVPFLDHELVEFTLSLPIDFLDGKSYFRKKILVAATEGILTDTVRFREDKKGFITPEEVWMRENHKLDFLKMFDTYVDYSLGIINVQEARNYIILVQQGKLPFDYTYWRIINFCVWMKVFQVELD